MKKIIAIWFALGVINTGLAVLLLYPPLYSPLYWVGYLNAAGGLFSFSASIYYAVKA